MAQSSTASTKDDDHGLQEVELELAGKTYRVRPTYRLIARIEKVLGVAAFEAGMQCWAARTPPSSRQGFTPISLGDLATIIGVALMDDPKAPKAGDIGDVLMEKGGFFKLLVPVELLLTRHLNGNEDYEREMRERAQEEGTPGSAAENPPAADAA